MKNATLKFKQDRVKLDGMMGLYCEEDGYRIKILDTVSSEDNSEVVDSSCLVSERRGKTFPYVFQLLNDGVRVRVCNPTIGLEVNDEKLTGNDSVHLSSNTQLRIGDMGFEVII